MVDQTQTPTPEPIEPISLRLESGSYSNTFKHNILYSVKNSKFIKGRAHKGAVWGVDYRILPGYYILWHAMGYKDIRGFEFSLKKVKIYKDEKGNVTRDTIETLCEFNKLTRDDVNAILRDPNAPESLKMFLECLPWGYHTVGCVPDTNKIYQPDEPKKVCEYLKSKLVELAEE